jgi:hypothetical protein
MNKREEILHKKKFESLKRKIIILATYQPLEVSSLLSSAVMSSVTVSSPPPVEQEVDPAGQVLPLAQLVQEIAASTEL